MQITAIEKNNRKKKNMKKAAISATVIFAMMTCLSFAYATSIFEAVGDALFSGTLIQNPLDVIVSSFLLLVFKTIIQCSDLWCFVFLSFRILRNAGPERYYDWYQYGKQLLGYH